MRAIRRFTVRPVLPEPLRLLGDLSTNLRWSWHPETQDVFAAIDPELWSASGRDPVKTLGAVSTAGSRSWPPTSGSCAASSWPTPTSSSTSPASAGSRRRPARTRRRRSPTSRPEYGITSVLPQYSGGLGILAGDHLKTASDLGVPLDRRRAALPARLLPPAVLARGLAAGDLPRPRPRRSADHACFARETEPPRRCALSVPGDSDLVARVFVAQVGRVPLLLLDTDIEDNPLPLREVTDRLYGGTTEHRLLQELLLGVGGVRAVRAFSRLTGHPEPEVFHTNEGHAGFLGLERIRELTVAEDGPELDFDTALEVTRAGTVFTTHTPVPAGIDRFPRELVEQYFGPRSAVAGVPSERILKLGAEDYTRRRPRRVQHGRDGLPPLAARQRRLAAARPRQPRHVQRTVAGLRRGRGADHLDHQRRARPDVGRPRGLRARQQGRRRHRLRRRGRSGTSSTRSRRPTCGPPSATCASAWSRTPVAGCASRASSGVPRRPSWAGSTPRSTPTC